jgi:signal transduction histidine kinase
VHADRLVILADVSDYARPSWKAIVKDLYRGFQQIDDEVELIRDIDQFIIAKQDRREPEASDGDETASERAGTLEALFTRSLGGVSRIFGLRQSGSCYLYTGRELLLLEGDETQGSALTPTRLRTTEEIERFASLAGQDAVVLSRAESSDGLFEQLTGTETLLLQPIFAHSRDLICVLVFQDADPLEVSRLTDPGFHASVASVARQLAIAYTHQSAADQEAQTRELWKIFLSSSLGPTQCFALLAHMVPKLLPKFGPLGLSVKPEVQILVVERTPDTEDALFLTIRATTGSEPTNTNINIADSIVGLLVERSPDDLPFFCDDPHDARWGDRYKSYLGLEKNTTIRTEFAVRLVTPDDEFVGILNLESELEDAFNLHDQAAILALASTIAPMVKVFEERIDNNAIMHRSVISTTSTYLDSLAGIFRHGIGTPLENLQTDVDFLRNSCRQLRADLVSERPETGPGRKPAGFTDAIEEDFAGIEKALDRLVSVRRQISAFAIDFSRDISGFSKMGAFPLEQLLTETISLAQNSLLAKSAANIVIQTNGETEASAYCSPLLKQHLFSVLTNAIYSITDRMTADPAPGLITVTIDRDNTPRASQEVDLNRRWLIRVRDNGGGATESQLEKLGSFVPGTRFRKSPGQGLGLLAVQRYVQSIGGRIELESEQGKFFEVRLVVDEYRADIHGPLSAPVKGAVQ